MISVIVAARNQAGEVKRCLNAILDGAAVHELEIIVACNGCSDETVEAARGFGPPVRVLEMPDCSVADALNLADRAASAFPRFYIQAGVVCRLSSIRQMAKHLADGEALAIAPPTRLWLDDSGPIVRSYYNITERLPSYLEGWRGSGVFGLSQAGRARLGEFPQIISIEEFVRANLKPCEFARLESTSSRITPPATFAGLLAAQAERIRGIDQLRALKPSVPIENGRADRRHLLRILLQRIDLWLELAVYVFVQVLARLTVVASRKRAAERPRVKIVPAKPSASEAAGLMGEISDPQAS